MALQGYLVLAVVALAAGSLLTGPVLDAPPGPADLEDVDLGLSRWLAERRSPPLDAVSAMFSSIGDTLPVIVVAAATGLWRFVRRLDWRPLLFVATVLVIELLVFLTTSYTIDRARPDVDRLGSTPSTGSFPSGHAAAGVALWVAIGLLVSWPASLRRYRRLAIGVGVAMGVAIGLARLYRGMHFATDILAGWVLGGASLVVGLLTVEAAVRAHRRVRRGEWLDRLPDGSAPPGPPAPPDASPPAVTRPVAGGGRSL
jgi:membrane-associated phospholipid phosphatase